MAQSGPPPYDGDESESPARRLVRLLKRHGLDESLRDILQSLEARQRGIQREIRTEVLDRLLEGQPPPTAQELEQARREWQE